MYDLSKTQAQEFIKEGREALREDTNAPDLARELRIWLHTAIANRQEVILEDKGFWLSYVGVRRMLLERAKSSCPDFLAQHVDYLLFEVGIEEDALLA